MNQVFVRSNLVLLGSACGTPNVSLLTEKLPHISLDTRSLQPTLPSLIAVRTPILAFHMHWGSSVLSVRRFGVFEEGGLMLEGEQRLSLDKGPAVCLSIVLHVPILRWKVVPASDLP